jgi:multidrug resistance efflux pump
VARLAADARVLRASLARIDRRIKAVERAPQDATAPVPPSDLDELLSERTGLAQRLQDALTAQAQAEAAVAGANAGDDAGAESAELADLALRRAQIDASAARARAQLAALQERAGSLKVTSPCDCVVAWVGALVGQPVDAGTPLVTLRDAAQGAGGFEALVDARSAAALRVGAAAWVDVEDGRVLAARVDQVLAAGNADPRAAATAGWAAKGYALVRLAAPQGIDLASLPAGAPVGVKISRIARASGAGAALPSISAAGEARAEAH